MARGWPGKVEPQEKDVNMPVGEYVDDLMNVAEYDDMAHELEELIDGFAPESEKAAASLLADLLGELWKGPDQSGDLDVPYQLENPDPH